MNGERKEPNGVFGRLRSIISFKRNFRVGIDSSFVFLEKVSSDQWQNFLGDMNARKRLILIDVVNSALSRSLEERNEYIKNLNSTVAFDLLITRDAKRQHEQELKMKQLQININAMSQENLENLLVGLFNLGSN